MTSFPDRYYLSDEQRKFYDDYGYIIIKNLIDVDTLNAIRQRFTDIACNKVPKGIITVVRDLELSKVKKQPDDYVNKINFLNFDPVFAKYGEHPRLLHVLSQIIGDNMSLYNSMLINKPPGSKWHPPHQDLFFLPKRPHEKIISTWTAIDPVTDDNGCLFAIPGSHKKNTLYEESHVPEKNFVNRYFFTISNVDEVAPVEKRVNLAPMQPGDTIFFNSLLVHGSWPNTADTYRKAITNVYANDDCHYIDVKGTSHEPFEAEINKTLKELYGSDMDELPLEDFIELRRKRITNSVPKSNL